MHRNKPFITNDTAQGLLVNVMGHHRETLIRMALDMAADTVMGATVGVGTAGAGTGTVGATVVDATTEVPYLS
jgi:hypothetical protein